jgi:hypothetical protein
MLGTGVCSHYEYNHDYYDDDDHHHSDVLLHASHHQLNYEYNLYDLNDHVYHVYNNIYYQQDFNNNNYHHNYNELLRVY